MTVEQSSLQQHNNSKRGREDKLVATYATVREVTGVDDQRVIDEAIAACRAPDGSYKVEDVVSMLVQDDTIRRRQRSNRNAKSVSFRVDQNQGQEVAKTPPPSQETTPRKNNVIDLTQEAGEQQEMNKAISASLQDAQGILGGQVTREEQDISRVLEASLAESKAGTKRKRGELWFVDPLNPHDRRRAQSWPVGLKNIGNTCWFSAVIQSLFYLPKFRRMVINFKCPMQSSGNTHERRNLRFMKELRAVFGLMVGSTRKYVDPSRALDILKEAFSSPPGVTDSQQDVSEFQHKLLEWLEDAFKSNIPQSPSPPLHLPEGSPVPPAVTNPVTELFYGQFRAEGEHEGEKFTKQETFGQFPLQVSGFRDIHQSLEATTAQDEIEAVDKDTPTKSGQELWFTRLPPVLTFELCRFQFNQQLGRPEKIHNKIEFPQVIYVDRYLENNKAVTRCRREESRKLKEQLTTVQARLDRFMNYGSGSKRCPLHDVLQYTLQFAESKPPAPSPSTPAHPSSADVEMESPKSCLNSASKPAEPGLPTVSMHEADNSASAAGGLCAPTSSPSVTVSLPAPLSAPSGGGGEREGAAGEGPCPREIRESELHVLQRCLRRWREEVEADVRELQSTISSLESKLDKMYSDESMQKFPYHLHAVLVHEGQAASGHYWAFVYDQSRQAWLKFNDITVSTATWEELERESIGGYHNASAYCLMYVDRARVQDDTERAEASSSSGSSLDSIEGLPRELQEAVAMDNKVFAQEVEDWDREQARKSTGDPDVTVTYEHRPSTPQFLQTAHLSQPSLPTCHAHLSFHDTVRAVDKVQDFLKANQPTTALTQAAASELKRLQGLAEALPLRLWREDARLRHVVVYLLCNKASSGTQHLLLLEQFAYLTVLDHDARTKQLRVASCEEINQMRKDNAEADNNVNEEYEAWHLRYHHFRQAVHMFVQGLQAYYKERYTEALPYFNQAWLHNRSACAGISTLAGIDNRLVSFFRSRCLQHVNGEAMQQFESESDVSEALTLMVHQILPSLAFLAQSGLDADSRILETLRSNWCAFLEKELTASKVEKLQDVLTRMFDGASEARLDRPQAVRLSDMTDLHARYTAVMATAHAQGDIAAALDTR